MGRFSRRAYLGAALAGGTTIAAGCIDVLGGGGGSGIPRHELLVLWGFSGSADRDAGIAFSSFEFDRAEEQYGDPIHWSPDDPDARISAVDAIDGGYVAVSSGYDSPSTVTRLDAEMTVQTTTELDGRATGVSDGEYVYTASDRRIVSFDRDLQRVGETLLPAELRGKYMESVLVHDGVGYVVDNVIYPKYLMQVDLRDPKNPSVRDVITRAGSNLHLGPQCLDPGSNRWVFTSSTSHRNGISQRVVATSMDATGESRDYTSEEVYYFDRDARERTGIYIDDLPTRAPVYAAVTEDDDEHSLSTVTVDPTAGEDDRIRFERVHELPGRGLVDTVSEMVVAFAGTAAGSVVLGYDTEGETVRFEQELDFTDPLEVRVRPV